MPTVPETARGVTHAKNFADPGGVRRHAGRRARRGAGVGAEGRRDALVDQRRGVARRRRVREGIQQARRHLGRRCLGRAAGRARGSAEPHRRGQSADGDAMEYRRGGAPVGGTGRADAARRSGEAGQLAGEPATAAGQEHELPGPRDRGAGEHPRRQLPVLQREGVRRAETAATEDVGRVPRDGAEDQGGRLHPDRVRRQCAATGLGVQRGGGGCRRQGSLPPGLCRARCPGGRQRGDAPRVRDHRCAPAVRRRRQPQPEVERTRWRWWKPTKPR